jgi:hypothetical protein
MCPIHHKVNVVLTSAPEPPFFLHDALSREGALEWQKAIQDDFAS